MRGPPSGEIRIINETCANEVGNAKERNRGRRLSYWILGARLGKCASDKHCDDHFSCVASGLKCDRTSLSLFNFSSDIII